MQAARTGGGKIEATLSIQLGILAEAGAHGAGWWPTFVAKLKAYVKGSLKITGDSPQEIFDVLLLTLSEVVRGAGSVAGAPPDDVARLAAAVVGGDTKGIVRNMGKEDGASVAVGGGAEAGAETPFGTGSIGAELMFSRRLENSDEDDQLETTDTTSLTVSGSLSNPKLGLTVPANVTFVSKQGKLDEWFVGLGVTGSLALGRFSSDVLVGTAWAQGFVNGMANLVQSTAKKGEVEGAGTLAQALKDISIADEAILHGVAGKKLAAAAATPAFANQAGQTVSFGADGQAGWSSEKGANLRVAISTAETWTLGEEGVTPIFIEARSGDTLVSFEAGETGGASFGT